MNSLKKLGMLAGLFFLGVPLGASVFWIEASEPQHSKDASLPARRVSPENRSADNQQDVSDGPPSALSPVNVLTDHVEGTGARIGIRDRQSAFYDFHEQFRIEFELIEDRFGQSRMWQPPKFNHSVRRYSAWIIVESSSGVRIKAKPLFANVDGGLANDAFTINESSIKDMARFPDLDELVSLQYLGANSDHMFDDLSLGLFDETVGLFNEPATATEWKLVRMELIGLLKHATPVSYVSPNVPKMNELKNVPTAPLNSFEQGAIDRLRSNLEEDAVVKDGKDEIQIVGALRASEKCRGCHAVKRGELLGALTYRLIRSGGIASRRDQNHQSLK